MVAVPASAADPSTLGAVADARDSLRQRALIEGAKRDRERRLESLERDRERRRVYDRAPRPSPSASRPGVVSSPATAEPFVPRRPQLSPLDADGGLVRRTQRALTRLGFEPGPVDGRLGPLTRSAVRAYQRDRGLSTTGEPSTALLRRLERDRQGIEPR